MTHVCKEHDKYVQGAFNRKEAIWIVKLSNGETIFQDDYRVGLKEHSAWLRLRAYCKEQRLHIIGMRLEFRSNKVKLPDNAEGYFFTKMAGAWIGQSTDNKYGIGILKDGEVIIIFYLVPELISSGTDVRKKEKCGECLITLTA